MRNLLLSTSDYPTEQDRTVVINDLGEIPFFDEEWDEYDDATFVDYDDYGLFDDEFDWDQ